MSQKGESSVCHYLFEPKFRHSQYKSADLIDRLHDMGNIYCRELDFFGGSITRIWSTVLT